MTRHQYDTNLERFVLGAAMFLIALLAGLVVANSLDEKCEGGRSLLSIPCHNPNEDSHGC